MREKILTVTIHDCVVQTFRSGGKGGQNQNKRDTGVRVIHEPSGARGESREERSQLQNKKTAFVKMVDTPQFRFWMYSVTNHLQTQKEIEAQIAEELDDPEVTVTEIRVAKDTWVQVDPSELS